MNFKRLRKKERIIEYEIQNPKLRELIEHVIARIPEKEEDCPELYFFEDYSVFRGSLQHAPIHEINEFHRGAETDEDFYILLHIHKLTEKSGGDRDVMIGMIAHEFAHAFLGHPYDLVTEDELDYEYEADKLVSKWEFEKEIKAFRQQIPLPPEETE